MRQAVIILFVWIITLNLYGCSTTSNDGGFAKQDIGMVSGGVLGGLVGSRFGGGSGQIVAVAAGTLAGAMLGSAVGRNMDAADQLQTAKSLENNSVGQPSYWRNSRTGVQYKVTPTHNIKVKGNPYCREYNTVANIGGKMQKVYGTACRQSDGSWKVIATKNG